MIGLQIQLIWPGCAQGNYRVKAKGYILAVLRWGTAEGALQDWSPFAYVPVDPAGNGVFFFPGKRAIPREATHVWARCYQADFSSYEDISAMLAEDRPAKRCDENAVHFSIFTDLHLAAKPWKIKQALRSAQSDRIFLLGDSTNDGLSKQFDAFLECIEETVPHKSLFPVTGNHDVLHPSRMEGDDGCQNYQRFQKQLLAKCEVGGHAITRAPDGRAYSVQMGDLDIIALQCVTTGRKFRFPDAEQINWLDEHLADTQAAWHIILCHAPLLKHNPNRNEGTPYLDQNKRIQELLDRHGRILFLNGHTHVSPNGLQGNAEYDEIHHNLYLDCASVVDTDLSAENSLMDPSWKDGCKTELMITQDTVEICMTSIAAGLHFPRGYYRFRV